MTDQANAQDPDGPIVGTPEPAQPSRPQRPAVLVFTQAVLLLQGFVALFATLVLWSFARNGLITVEPWMALAGGLTLMVALLYASGKQAKRWGRIVGWLLQVPMLAAVFLEPAVAVIGAIFLILWIMALRIGSRIDRERKERDEAAERRSADAARADGDADPA